MKLIVDFETEGTNVTNALNRMQVCIDQGQHTGDITNDDGEIIGHYSLANEGLEAPVIYKLVDHGIDSPDYFPGYGLACTPYDDVYIGNGNNPKDALEETLTQAALDGWDSDLIETLLLKDYGEIPDSPDVYDEYKGDVFDAPYYYMILYLGRK